ncbi:MAG: hypothetical protein M1549_02185 [Candidatus Dependentiae bacterium]|nr:hypothetical protein [Candidatus Dependentiae bacterium]
MCGRYPRTWIIAAMFCSAMSIRNYAAEQLMTPFEEISDAPTLADITAGDTMSPALQRLLTPAMIYEMFLKTDPYKKRKASVRTWKASPTLSTEERTFLKVRDTACNAAVAKILGQPIELKHTPRIAFLGSGGSIRASLFSAGGLKTLAEQGLIDTFHYVGAVSGSSWVVLPWQVSGKPFDQFYPTYIDRVVYGLIPQTLTQGVANLLYFTDTIAATLLRTFAFLDIPSSIDIYGLFLGLSLLGDTAKLSYADTTLPSLTARVKDGQNPLPLCTAVIPSNKDMLLLDVVECTPLEVIDYSSNTAVPAWACGRTFKNGISTNIHPSLTIGYLMGVCGSAFTAITMKDLWPMILAKLWPKELFAPLTDLFEETKVGNLRVFPAHMRNFSYGMNGIPHQNDQFNLWVDAGISIDIPIVPFLKHPERNIDIYIICDAGGDVKWSSVIEQSERYARQYNYRFPHCNPGAASISTLSVFDDGPQSSAPIVIYLPMIKNERYNSSFDPQDMMYNNTPGNFLATENFIYTKQQAELLAGLSSFSMAEAQDVIVDAIKAMVARKKNGIRPPSVYGNRVLRAACDQN